jgi:hypothetical protein
MGRAMEELPRTPWDRGVEHGATQVLDQAVKKQLSRVRRSGERYWLQVRRDTPPGASTEPLHERRSKDLRSVAPVRELHGRRTSRHMGQATRVIKDVVKPQPQLCVHPQSHL